MPQENLNKIWKAGKYFEEPKTEQPTKEPTSDKTKPSTVKRKISVVKAFIPTQEDPFKKKVEAVLRGVEEKTPELIKPISTDTEHIIMEQDHIGRNLVMGRNVYVTGNAGDWTGEYMTGGKIHVKGNAGNETGNHMFDGEIYAEGCAGTRTGYRMSGGALRIDGDVASFDESAFYPDNKGTIIWKGETIWKNGQKEEPGWTNLNVKEKIAK